jgi:RHS repeat-associated protein
MTHDASYSYTWNGESELTSFAGSYNYTYDGDHKRVENSYNGYYYWFSPNGLPLAETNSVGTTQKEYIYFNGARTALRNSYGNQYYYFSDQIGTAQMLTNSSGTVCYDSDNTPFGYVMAYTTSCPQDYQLAGMELDGGTGNYHTWFRNYEPNLGRWMSPDPAGKAVADPAHFQRPQFGQRPRERRRVPPAPSDHPLPHAVGRRPAPGRQPKLPRSKRWAQTQRPEPSKYKIFTRFLSRLVNTKRWPLGGSWFNLAGTWA